MSKIYIKAQNDNSFSFLKIKIARHNQQFKTSFCRKPTFSGVFTHCESYLYQIYKSLIDTLKVENLRETLKRIAVRQELHINS